MQSAYTLFRLLTNNTNKRIFSEMNLIVRNTSQLGAAIRRNRKKQGLTQSALAERMHTRQATISTLEKGEAALSTFIDALTALNLEMVIRPRSKASIQDFLEDTT